MKGKFLITTEQWFYAPDGRKYKAVWGNVNILTDDHTLGVKTNMRSTNWYAMVGTKSSQVVIAGCQIHYAVRCPQKPNTKDVQEIQYGEAGINRFDRPSEIYIAE